MGRTALGYLPQRAFAIYRANPGAVPDIAEMPLLAAVTQGWRPEHGGVLPTGMTHTVIGNSPGVLRSQSFPQGLRSALVVRSIDIRQFLLPTADIMKLLVQIGQ